MCCLLVAPDFSRVVAEGSDLNDLQRAGWADDARVDSRVESFCMEKSGHDPCLDTQHGFCGDQGAIFFTPNATWGQPPFYVHEMILNTAGQDHIIDAEVLAGGGGSDPEGASHGLNVLAAISNAKDKIVLRVANPTTASINVTIEFGPSSAAASSSAPSTGDTVSVRAVPPTSYVVTTLASTTGTAEGPDTDNPVWDTRRHSPVVSAQTPFEPKKQMLVPAVSFSIYVFSM